ncbi:MAG TPA: thioredoxin family protein [Methanomicrobia archaeon]|nr:thioredoxin family protein [Methanomicrobia archaeon]
MKILGTGCPKCRKAYANAQRAIADLGIEVKLEKVEDFDEILRYGVMITPTVVIDGRVRASGRIPSREELKQWLQECPARLS